jgi:hypothetical protein
LREYIAHVLSLPSFGSVVMAAPGISYRAQEGWRGKIKWPNLEWSPMQKREESPPGLRDSEGLGTDGLEEE